MMRTRMKTEKLVKQLKKNRTKHRKVVDEAWEGYREEAVSLLKTNMKKFKGGSRETLYVALATPQDHTQDYDTMISMLESTEDDIIDLTQTEYENFVLDRWSWTHGWASTNSLYAASAASYLPDED